MPGNTFGHTLRLTSFGESHGAALGGVLDGLPPLLPLSLEDIQPWLDRRRPGQSSYTTPRQEQDQIEILSGLFEGKTTGTPLAFLIRNCDQKSQDYERYKDIYRPGHGDFSYHKKYGIYDYRGGGRSSARETLIRVAAGAIAYKLLNHILKTSVTIQAALVQLGHQKIDYTKWNWKEVRNNPFSCPDPDSTPLWEKYLQEMKEQGRSVGALIEVHADGIPAGLGEPVYDKLDADLAKALMSINAVKAVEIGSGFSCITANRGFDELTQEGFQSNQAGGILAGISTGAAIVCRVAFKPTSSTKEVRQTLSHSNESRRISIEGRHDPCVALRAPVIVESMVALTLADHLLRWNGQCGYY